MASAGPPPLSADGLWFWDGSGWRSLVSADGQKSWDGKSWTPLPPTLAGQTLQPPSGPPPGLVEGPWQPPAAPPTAQAPNPPAGSAPGALPSPPGYAPPPSPGSAAGAPPPPPPPPAPPAAEVEPRPAWLPADAAWPPATFTASAVPLTTDAPMAAPAPGAVPWANVYSNVIASSTASQGYSYAGFWIRVVANIVDTLIILVPVLVIYFLLLAATAASARDSTQAQSYISVYRLLSAAISFGYFVYFWTLGSTPGMRLVGIRVADQGTFQSIGMGKALLRYFGYLVSSFCCLIGFVWVAFDSHKQGWHDKIGGTVVIYR